MTMHKKRLKPQYTKFVNSYLTNGGNQTAAARDAGYTANNASVTAGRLMKMPEILEAIEFKQNKAAETADVTVQWIADKLKDESIDPDNKASDRIRSLELLGKFKRMFVEVSESLVHHDIVELQEFSIDELRALRSAPQPIHDVEILNEENLAG